MQTLQVIWFVLIGVLLSGYAVLDGFDLGVGILYPFIAKTDEERSAVRSCIGPVWDGNEVWLLAGGGGLFAAFPAVYATTFSGFYLAMILVLMGLIFRAVSLEFAGSDPAWRRIWHWGLFGGSLLPGLLFGVAVGNIILGVPFTAAGEFGGDFFSLLNPYALLIGVTGLAMFIAHGSTWAVVKTEGVIRDRALKIRTIATWVFATLAVVAAAATALLVPARFSQVMASPLGWLFVVLLVAGLVWNVLSQRSGRELHAFYGSAVSVVSMVGIWAVSQFPSLLPSIDGTPGLTAFNSSSSQLTLTVMLIVAGIGVPVMLGYTALVYSKFTGKVRAGAGY